MKKRLKRNICKLDDNAVLSNIKDLPTVRATHIGNTLEYACQLLGACYDLFLGVPRTIKVSLGVTISE